MGNLMDELEGVYICDECDTLATVSVVNGTITLVKCECVTLDWNE